MRFNVIRNFIVSVLVSAILPISGVSAQGQGALIIRNDMGGRIDVRAKEIAALRSEGRPVELRGEVCLSSCTMFLALDTTCVDQRTQFGFHGPSEYGRAMTPEWFEYWSVFLGGYYKPALRKWFMEKARYKLDGYTPISGAELVRLGYKPCA